MINDFEKFFARCIVAVIVSLFFVAITSMVTTHLEKMAAIEAGLVQIYDPEHNKLIWVMPRKESTNAQTYNDS